MYVVIAYRTRPKSTTYDGTGSTAHNIIREFNDKPSAHRFAKNIVECGPCWFATVKEQT